MLRKPESPPSPPLDQATVQEIQLELIRRTCFNEMNGRRVFRALQDNRELWTAALLDRAGGWSMPDLIKLRDLPENTWNVDTLYVLTPDADAAHRLARLIESEDWGGMVQV